MVSHDLHLDPEASGQKKEQYFEIMGSRAIYQDEWIASVFGPRIPWKAGLDPAISNGRRIMTYGNSMISPGLLPGKERRGRSSGKGRGAGAFGVQAEANKVFPVGGDCGLPFLLKMRRPIPRPVPFTQTWSVSRSAPKSGPQQPCDHRGGIAAGLRRRVVVWGLFRAGSLCGSERQLTYGTPVRVSWSLGGELPFAAPLPPAYTAFNGVIGLKRHLARNAKAGVPPYGRFWRAPPGFCAALRMCGPPR